MSCYGYIYLKISELATLILEPYKVEGLDTGKVIGRGAVRGNMELRELFAEHLERVAYCAQKLEQADNGDISEDIAYEEIEDLLFGDLDMLGEQGLLDTEEVTPA